MALYQTETISGKNPDMEEKIIQYIKNDKELQKHIVKLHLKSNDMFNIFLILGFFLFFELLFVVVWPIILIPIIIAEILFGIYSVFKPKYTVEEYEVKAVYNNIISSKLKYYECIITKPGNKGLDGYVSGKIIKSRNENIGIGDEVIGIKIGKEVIVIKYNS